MSEYTTASELFDVNGYYRNPNKEIPSKVYEKILELINALDCELTIDRITWFEQQDFVDIEFSRLRVLMRTALAGWTFNWFQSYPRGNYDIGFQYHFGRD